MIWFLNTFDNLRVHTIMDVAISQTNYGVETSTYLEMNINLLRFTFKTNTVFTPIEKRDN